jgi:hypothetical protein
MAALPQIEQMSDALPEFPREGKFKPKEPLFNFHQQKAFDRAFAKREAKLRAEYEEKLSRSNADLLETVTLAYRLLKKCDDRMSRTDAREIEVGLLEITREYGNSRTN